MNEKFTIKLKSMLLFIIINLAFATISIAQNCTNNLLNNPNFEVEGNTNLIRNNVELTAGQIYKLKFDAEFSANRDNITKLVGVNFMKNNQFFQEFSEVVTTRSMLPYEIVFTAPSDFNNVTANVFAYKDASDVSITVRNACLTLQNNSNSANSDFCENDIARVADFSIKPFNIKRNDIIGIDANKKYILTFKAKIDAGSNVKIAGISFNKSGRIVAEFSKQVNTQLNDYSIEFTAPGDFNNANIFAYKTNSNATLSLQDICLKKADDVTTGSTGCLGNIAKKASLKISGGTNWDGDLEVGKSIQANKQYVLSFLGKIVNPANAQTKIAGISFKQGNQHVAEFRKTISTEQFKPYEIVFTAPAFSTANTFVWKSNDNGQTTIELKDVCLREIPRSTGFRNISVLKNYPKPSSSNNCGMYVGIASPINSHHIEPRTFFNNAFNNNFNIIVPENGLKMGTLKTGITHGGVTPVGKDVWNTEPLEQEINWANRGIPIRGHTLCWHGGIKDEHDGLRTSKNPDYLKDMSNLNLERELKRHIRETINYMNNNYTFSNGKPRVESWDVVNEALRGNDSDSRFGPFRTFNAIEGDVYIDEVTQEVDNRNTNGNANGIECVWEKLGYNANYTFSFNNGPLRAVPNYIITAFKEAESVINSNSNTKNQALVYNDWGAEFEGSYGNKAEVQFQMIKALKNHPTQPIRIDGIGFQCHFSMRPGDPAQITYDRLQSFKKTIERYTTEWPDIKIYFTEIDITLPDNADNTDIESQAMYYKLLAQLAASIPQTEAFITWGLIDRLSWVNNDQTRAPLLFRKDRNNYMKKQTYFEVLEALKEADCSSSTKFGSETGELENQMFEVYPNPFNQYLSISTTNQSGHLKVYDMTGRLRIAQKVNGEFTNINTNSLHSGYYLIELESNGLVSRQKIIKH